jgi:hypothetical protein
MAVTENAPYFEQWWRWEPGYVLGNNSGWNYYNIGSFTMPWKGQAIADLTVNFDWDGTNGYQQVTTSLAWTNPVPTQNTQLNRLASNLGGRFRGYLPQLARWENLAANQTVALTLGVFVGGGGWNVTFYRVAGSVRASPAA